MQKLQDHDQIMIPKNSQRFLCVLAKQGLLW